MERVCGSCGRDAGTGAFCPHCGAQVDVVAAPSSPEPTPSSPEAVSTDPPRAPAKRRGCGTVFLIAVVVVIGLVAVGGLLAWRYVDNEVLANLQGFEAMEDMVGQFETLDLVPGPPGPCFDLEVDGGLVTGFDEVDCDGPRDVEAFFSAQFRDESFPGDGYLADAAEHTCGEAFIVYVGATVEASRYSLDWLVPSAQTWADGDREAVCLVVSADGSPLTGTIKGSAT